MVDSVRLNYMHPALRVFFYKHPNRKVFPWRKASKLQTDWHPGIPYQPWVLSENDKS